MEEGSGSKCSGKHDSHCLSISLSIGLAQDMASVDISCNTCTACKDRPMTEKARRGSKIPSPSSKQTVDVSPRKNKQIYNFSPPLLSFS
jgi:hypothetical protein